MRTCQGCGSPNIRKIDRAETYRNGKPSGIFIDRFTCRECGHLSIYDLKEENWRVG
jgi:RNase P subunit RPR2